METLKDSRPAALKKVGGPERGAEGPSGPPTSVDCKAQRVQLSRLAQESYCRVSSRWPSKAVDPQMRYEALNVCFRQSHVDHSSWECTVPPPPK